MRPVFLVSFIVCSQLATHLPHHLRAPKGSPLEVCGRGLRRRWGDGSTSGDAALRLWAQTESAPGRGRFDAGWNWARVSLLAARTLGRVPLPARTLADVRPREPFLAPAVKRVAVAAAPVALAKPLKCRSQGAPKLAIWGSAAGARATLVQQS